MNLVKKCFTSHNCTWICLLKTAFECGKECFYLLKKSKFQFHTISHKVESRRCWLTFQNNGKTKMNKAKKSVVFLFHFIPIDMSYIFFSVGSSKNIYQGSTFASVPFVSFSFLSFVLFHVNAKNWPRFFSTLWLLLLLRIRVPLFPLTTATTKRRTDKAMSGMCNLTRL